METATVPRSGEATGSRTIADLLPRAVEQFGPKPAIRYKDETGSWATISYADVGDRVRKVALGLMDLGIKKGDKVSILSNTRPEWSLADFAILTAGATAVPIYQTNSPDECAYVLENSDAKAVVVEDDAQLEKIRAVRDGLPKLKHVIRMTGASDDAISLGALEAKGAEGSRSDWEKRWSSVEPDEICTIIYTSGTTGPPKGCVISHGNYRAMLDMSLEADVLEPDKTTYLFLPLAHSFALLIQLLSFDTGGELAYWERDPLKIVPNLSEVRPHYFPSVPRIFEKIYAAATGNAEKAGGLKRRIFWWSIGIGRKVRELERRGEEPGFLLERRYRLADAQVLSKIRGLFGGRVEQCITGAAPINPEILRFFDAAGILVLEGWGMTETSTAATFSQPDAFRFGTVGKPFKGVEVRTADDGEILVRGDNVFQGYYKNDEATEDTLIDGWLHTGDVGQIDEDGFVSITGRKKDIIITAGGKNITPANLEAEIKQHPLVSQAVVIGDRRPYLTALVTLDQEELVKHAEESDLDGDPVSLSRHESIRGAVEGHVEEVNERFARVEQVKKIRILPQDLSQEGGELTPTLKVKRNVVAEKYEDEIEALYAG